MIDHDGMGPWDLFYNVSEPDFPNSFQAITSSNFTELKRPCFRIAWG